MSIYGENTAFELIRCNTDEQWREQRTHGIGGSDVAALMGLSPWKTPLQLWLEKTGREEPEDLSAKPYVQFGTDFEANIGAWYKRKHPSMQVRRVNAMAKSLDRPWATASLDYEIRDYASQTWGVLEIKTARDEKDWADGVPIYYMTQVLHYLSVMQREYAHVCVFFRDTCEYATYLIRRDEHEEDYQAVIDAVDLFWRHYVEHGIMPAVRSKDTGALSRMFKNASSEIEFTDSESFDVMAKEYQQAKAEKKEAKKRKDYAAAVLMELIGERKGLESETYRVTNVRSKTSKLDTKKLKEEQPDIYEKYTSEAFRAGGLRIKEL